jgi:hypothetical protein
LLGLLFGIILMIVKIALVCKEKTIFALLDVDSHLGRLEGVGRSHCGKPVWVVTGVIQSTTCMCGTTG